LPPGDVIGEIGFFGSPGRRTASVTAASDGQVLVLRRHFVDELMKSDPACAAEVLFGLARVLADRQYVPAP
jgi:CRP-like cAMP-binding protein